MTSKLISIGELIDLSWERYREHLGSYLSISAWTLIVAILNIIAVAFYPSASKLLVSDVPLTGLEIFGVSLYAFSSLVIAPLLNVFVLIGITRTIQSVLGGRGVNLKRTMSEIKQRFWPTTLISIMLVLIVVLGAILPLLPAGIIGLLNLFIQNSVILAAANILLILGVFVAAFFVVRWGVDFYLAPYLVIQEDQKVRVSLLNSRMLVKGKFWQVFFRIIAPKIVFILFGILMLWIVNVVFTVIISGIGGLNLDLEVRIMSLTDSIFPVAVAMLIQPLVILSDVLLLKSLKDA